MKRFLALSALMGALFSAQAAHATCIDDLLNLPAYNHRPMSMVQQQPSNGWVAYSTGDFFFKNTGNWSTQYVEADNVPQVFSDRYTSGQFFAAGSADKQRVRVYRNGNIEIYNYTWNFTTTVAGSCRSNIIVGQLNGQEVIISWSLGVY